MCVGHHPRAAGGNGAPGGSVVLRASKHLTGLGTVPLHIEADRGGNGGKQWMDGRKGADKIVPVPLGTLVYQLVEVQGREGRSTPHGVTALPHTATAQTAVAAAKRTGDGSLVARPQQQQQQQQPDLQCAVQQQPPSVVSSAGPADASAEAALGEVQPLDNRQQQWQQQPSELLHKPKRLFTHDQLQAAQQSIARGDIGQQQQHFDSPVSSGMTPVGPESPRDVMFLEPPSGAAQYTADSLYNKLVNYERVLTSSEKLHLLNTGCLTNTHSHQHDVHNADSAGVSAWHEPGHCSDSDHCEGVSSSRRGSSSGELGSSQHPGDSWSDDGSEADEDTQLGQDVWLGAEDMQPQRRFTKQQV